MSADRPRSDIKEPVPLSFPQRRIWFLQNIYDDTVMYNVTQCFHIQGVLEIEAVRAALNALAMRHEPLRSRFQIARDGTPFQWFDKEPQIAIEYTDTGNTPAAHRRDQAGRIIREAITRPFNLFDGPLMRVVCARLSESESILLFVKHHLVTDGWAWTILLQEFKTLYTAMTGGLPPPSLPSLKLRYSDFAKNQAKLLTDENVTEKRRYWHAFFSGCSHTGHDGRTLFRYGGNDVFPSYGSAWQTIPTGTIIECKANASRHQCTLFLLVLTAICLFVRHLYRDPRVVVCLAYRNRRRPGTLQLVGCFFTNLILSLHIPSEYKTVQMLQDVKEAYLHARLHQDMPFEMFASDLDLECTRQKQPPYRVYCSYHPADNEVEFKLPDARLTPMEAETGRNTREDIVFNIWERLSEGMLHLDIQWLWRTDVFDRETITGLFPEMEALFRELGGDVGESVGETPDH